MVGVVSRSSGSSLNSSSHLRCCVSICPCFFLTAVFFAIIVFSLVVFA